VLSRCYIIGDIEVAVRAERHGSRQIEPAGNFGVLVLAVNAQDLASAGRGELIACGVLQHVATAPAISAFRIY
jgi:hypothetical protein